MESFELGQIWITDPKIAPLDERQRDRMQKEFGTTSIPLHVVVDPFSGTELARFRYSALMSGEEYIAFLNAGTDAFRKARAQ